MPHGNFAIETLLVTKNHCHLKLLQCLTIELLGCYFCFYGKHTPALNEGGKDLSENNS